MRAFGSPVERLRCGRLLERRGVGQAARIAVWNGSRWSALGTLLGHTRATSVYAVAVDGAAAIVGGDLPNAGERSSTTSRAR